MEKYHRFAAIQLIEGCGVRRIARPFIAVHVPQADAVRLQRIERVLDLFQASVLIGKRQ